MRFGIEVALIDENAHPCVHIPGLCYLEPRDAIKLGSAMIGAALKASEIDTEAGAERFGPLKLLSMIRKFVTSGRRLRPIRQPQGQWKESQNANP